MKIVMSSAREVSGAVSTFKKGIENAATTKDTRTWTFPNGDKIACETFAVHTTPGALLIAIPKKWNGRYPHLFALNPSGAALTPDVEINIPDHLDRKVSGVYVKNGTDTLICHRGSFTAYRGKIPYSVSRAYFEKWMYKVRDGGRDNSMIGVASLGSPTMADEIAAFVLAVREMKAQVKTDEPIVGAANAVAPSVWRHSYEFEGRKSPAASAVPKDYEYLHGPLCNYLASELRKLVSNKSTITIASNQNVDVAIVDTANDKASAIFEVKTSTSLSSQLYSAIGQLTYYKFKYGKSDAGMYLVLPSEVRNELSCGNFLASLGIGVIFRNNTTFESADGVPLSDLVNQYARA